MMWDVRLGKTLVHEGSRFEMQIRFACDVPRLALFGPSGAGKSQTLRMIAGLLRPDDGHIQVAGRTLFAHADSIDLSPRHRRLAYVFQDYALFPHLTVRQNIAFALRRGWRNPGRGTCEDIVEHWIQTFGLGSVATHFPHQISGGQRQRTALARSLVNAPRALLLDEPFAALDQNLRRHLREELARLQEQLNIPMLLITHDEEDVRMLADDVVHLEAGRTMAANLVERDGAMQSGGAR